MKHRRPDRRLILLALLCLPVLFFVLFTLRITDQIQAAPIQQDENLIQNPGFEGNYSAWSGIPEIQVAANWTPWWWDNPSHDPAYFRPEYKRAQAAVFPKRVLSGNSAQQWFTFHASHLAGMYQQVFNVTPGQRYRFTIWTQVWSSLEDDPNTSVLPANPHLQIGIDPTGNWDPGSPNIVWSPEASMASIIDQWGFVSVETTAQNDVLTVFMRTNPDFANKHNDMFWDQAGLSAAGPPEPTDPPPTATTHPETSTPQVIETTPPTGTPFPPQSSETPTSTTTATNTATATVTVAATETSTVAATSTPSPIPATDTPTPWPTDTSEPEATPPSTEVAALSPTAEFDVSGEPSDTVDQESGTKPFSLALLVLFGLAIILLLVAVVLLLSRARRR